MQNTSSGPDRLQNFPISFFSMVMGLTGLTIAWEKALHTSGQQPLAVDVLLVGSALLFLGLLAIYITKTIRHTQAVVSELRHPVKLNFFPAISISMLLLSIALVHQQPGVAEPLWLMGTALHLALTLYVVNAWMHHEHFEVKHINPAWFIPAVGNVVIPVAGVTLGYHEASWFFFSVGMMFWAILLTIIFYRLMFHSPMDAKLLPTLFILIAPPAVGFIAYMRLTGELDVFGRMLYFIALFMTLVLFTQAPRFLKLRFFLSWWAYSFPLAAISIASMLMAEASGVAFYGRLGTVLLVLLSTVVGYLMVRTIGAVIRRGICVAEQ